MLEGIEHFRCRAIKHDFDEHQQRYVEQLRVQLGRIAHDVTGFVQLAHALRQAAGDRFTRAASSTLLMRPSLCNSIKIFLLILSSIPITPKLILFG